MKKLILLFICLFAAPARPMKPMLGRLPDWSRFPHPVALWVMNEGAGSNIYDLSGNGNTLNWIGTPAYLSGKFGTVLDFPSTGNSEYLQSVSSPAKGFGSEGAFVWWVYIDSIVNYGTHIFCSGIISGNGIQILNRDAPSFTVGHWNTAATKTVSITATTLSTGQWYQCAYVWSTAGGYGRLYVNGALYASDTSITGTLETPNLIEVGAYGTAARGLDGKIDHIAGFDSALTAQQIAYLYRNPFPWFAPSAEWWGGTIVTVADGQIIWINF